MTAGMLTYKMRRKLKTLERRADHIAEAIRTGRGSTASLDRYAEELSALEWAIETINAYHQESGKAA